MTNQEITTLLKEVSAAKTVMECAFAEWHHDSFNLGEYFYRQARETYYQLKKELEIKIKKYMDTLKEKIDWLEWAIESASFRCEMRLSLAGHIAQLKEAKKEYEELKKLLN